MATAQSEPIGDKSGYPLNPHEVFICTAAEVSCLTGPTDYLIGADGNHSEVILCHLVIWRSYWNHSGTWCVGAPCVFDWDGEIVVEG